jgi:hypothetical protein
MTVDPVAKPCYNGGAREGTLMRDYPNMSYCAFENTSNAMDQVASMLEAAIERNEPLKLNKHEQRPYKGMRDKCLALMEILEQHQKLAEAQDGADPEEAGPDHNKLWYDTSAELT